MIFDNVQSLKIPVNGAQKEVTKITDSSGNIIWEEVIQSINLSLTKTGTFGSTQYGYTGWDGGTSLTMTDFVKTVTFTDSNIVGVRPSKLKKFSVKFMADSTDTYYSTSVNIEDTTIQSIQNGFYADNVTGKIYYNGDVVGTAYMDWAINTTDSTINDTSGYVGESIPPHSAVLKFNGNSFKSICTNNSSSEQSWTASLIIQQ